MKILYSLLTLACLLMTGCTPQTTKHKDSSNTWEITDLCHRTVTVPQKPRRILCMGAGALRLYSYVGDLDRLCGVEACEKKFLISVRPYQMVHEKRFLSLPTVGTGGPTGHPEPEALLLAQPDLVFTTYIHDPAALDDLQQRVGIPIVALSYGQKEAVDPAIATSLQLIGKLTQRTRRAQVLTDYMKQLQDDLKRRTCDIPQPQKPTVYLACHSNYGTHGFSSSTANYPLFQAIHARNVLDENGFKGYQKQVDREAILRMNPDKIILDAGGWPIFMQEVAHHWDFFQGLKAFRNGEIYVQLPYNAYYTNLEIAYANAYFNGKVLYPQAFQDIDPATQADRISRMFLGQDTYQAIVRQLQSGFRKLNPADLKPSHE